MLIQAGIVILVLLLHLCLGDTWICQSNPNQIHQGQLVIKEPRENFIYKDLNIPLIKVIPRRPVRLECICHDPHMSNAVLIGRMLLPVPPNYMLTNATTI